jgi:soluble lytic murein transglycosylase-like protein
VPDTILFIRRKTSGSRYSRRTIPDRLAGRAQRLFIFTIFAAISMNLTTGRAQAQAVGLSQSTAYTAPEGVPSLLSASDLTGYLRIFDFQDRGQFQEAAHIANTIENPILMGYVEFQKLMHPTAYTSTYAELHRWLENYRDLPDAERIHSLALRRQPSGAQEPADPIHYPAPSFDMDQAARSDIGRPGLSGAQRNAVNRVLREVRARVADGWPTGAREILSQDPAATFMSAGERIDAARAIARGYFRAGKYDDALAEADLAWIGGADGSPVVHWWGGLAAWKLGRMEDAQRHFSSLATYHTQSQWVLSAAAYWAARAHLAGRQPREVNRWLATGAAYPHTFYGILSRRALGYPLNYDWTPPPLDQALLARVLATPQGRRAAALTQIGMSRNAEAELTNLAGKQPELTVTIMAMAARSDMPALTKRLSGTRNVGSSFAAAMYPVPSWTPDGGFSVDRALIYAFIRQESAFNEEAKSRAGARGLMQLMPSTASYVAGDRSLRSSGSDRLFDPGLNLRLGQLYISTLLGREEISADLFKLAVAYNAGPGNLDSWLDSLGYLR